MLEIEGLTVSYGGVTAVRGLSLRVAAGEVVSIIGPNGAGKSTTLTAIAGGVRSDAGSVIFAGVELLGLRPEQIARKGISFVPEGHRVFRSLTVEENLAIGTYACSAIKNAKQDITHILKYFPHLSERRGSLAGRLSGGEQQMLVIARCMLMRPQLLMIDEPSLGLAPRVVEQVYEILANLRRHEGLTLLIVEQSSHRILKHADRIYVIRNGRIQLEDLAANLQDGEAIKAAYFGFANLTTGGSHQPSLKAENRP